MIFASPAVYAFASIATVAGSLIILMAATSKNVFLRRASLGQRPLSAAAGLDTSSPNWLYNTLKSSTRDCKCHTNAAPNPKQVYIVLCRALLGANEMIRTPITFWREFSRSIFCPTAVFWLCTALTKCCLSALGSAWRRVHTKKRRLEVDEPETGRGQLLRP